MENTTLSSNERARLRCQLVKELEEAGNYEAARGAMGELWQRVGERPKLDDLDLHTRAEVLLRAGVLSGWIGSAQQIEGAQERAKDLISESLAIFESLGETKKVAEAQTDLAYCYWREGAFDEARVTLADVLAGIAETNREQGAVALLRSTLVEISTGRYNGALGILTEATPLFEASANHTLKGKFHNQLALVLRNLGTAEHREDYSDRALVEYAAASFHFEQAGHLRYRARVENNLGFLFYTAGKFKQAHDHLDRARRLFKGLKDSGSVAQVNESRARVFLAEKRHDEAAAAARAAVRTLEQGDESALLAEALISHATALARTGRHDQARLALQRATAVAEQAGDKEGAGRAQLTIIEELRDSLSFDQMRTVYESADVLLAHSQHPETLTRLRSCARWVLTAMHERAREFSPSEFIHASSETTQLLRNAHRIASTDSAVLITGETGTGKEVLARLIHEWSGRPGLFVPVNCAAIPENLLETELFGHKKGSFTDAVADHPGMIRHAAGGTLFLDEVGELSAGDQGKLLRVVEHGEIHPIGAAVPEHVDVRIIAATNRNLKEQMVWGYFRSDLFYRLQTFHLQIPPLRERRDDIPALAEYFILRAHQRYARHVQFTPEAIEAMRELPLRGNARELRSLIERAVLVAGEGAVIRAEAVQALALRQTPGVGLESPWTGCSLEQEVLRYEGELIKLALETSKGRITDAARLLGTTHQALGYILKGRHKNLLTARNPAKQRKRRMTAAKNSAKAAKRKYTNK